MTILTLEEAAAFLKMSPTHLRKHAKQNSVPGKKLGKQWRFVQEVLEEFLVGHIDDYKPKRVRKKKESKTSDFTGSSDTSPILSKVRQEKQNQFWKKNYFT